MPDGRILYSSVTVEGEHIWIMEADGSRPKRLTSGYSRNFLPFVSPDGRRIVFSSNRNGNFNLWQMKLEGGELTQLTRGESDLDSSYTPDGKWIVYASYISGAWTLCKIPSEGGEPMQLSECALSFPAVSPDGKHVACEYVDAKSKESGVLIVSIDGGPAKKLPYSPSSYNLRWLRDGKGVVCILDKDDVKDFWLLPIDGSPPKRLSDLKMQDEIRYFDWSPDGKRLIFDQTIVLHDIYLLTNSN
jgi:Tol biopolymer transport system component